jgi:hypothetical protein
MASEIAYVEGAVYLKAPRSFSKLDLAQDLTHGELGSAKFRACMRSGIPVTMFHDNIAEAEKNLYEAGEKCTGKRIGQEINRLSKTAGVVGTVVNYWHDSEQDAWKVGIEMSPDISDLWKGMIQSGYFKLSLSHQRRDDQVAPVEVALTAAPLRKGCEISSVMSDSEYKSSRARQDNTTGSLATSAMDQNEENAAAASAVIDETVPMETTTAEPDANTEAVTTMRTLAEVLNQVKDPATKEKAMAAIMSIESAFDRGRENHSALEAQISDLQSKHTDAMSQLTSMKETHGQNVGSLVQSLGELADLVNAGSMGECSQEVQSMFEAHPTMVAPMATLVSASLAMARKRKAEPVEPVEEQGTNEAVYSRLAKSISQFGAPATEYGVVRASRAAAGKRRKTDEEPEQDESTTELQRRLTSFMDKHRRLLASRGGM